MVSVVHDSSKLHTKRLHDALRVFQSGSCVLSHLVALAKTLVPAWTCFGLWWAVYAGYLTPQHIAAYPLSAALWMGSAHKRASERACVAVVRQAMRRRRNGGCKMIQRARIRDIRSNNSSGAGVQKPGFHLLFYFDFSLQPFLVFYLARKNSFIILFLLIFLSFKFFFCFFFLIITFCRMYDLRSIADWVLRGEYSMFNSYLSIETHGSRFICVAKHAICQVM